MGGVESNCESPIPEGESRAILVERTARALRNIVRETVARGENRAIIVAHGGTIMAAMEAFARTRRDYFSWQVEPCGGYRATARFIDGELSIEYEQRFSADSFPALDEPSLAAHPASASFFQNRACPHFPCHEGIAARDFNCLFCYCPLYALGPNCGGNFTYTERGRKNWNVTFPTREKTAQSWSPRTTNNSQPSRTNSHLGTTPERLSLGRVLLGLLYDVDELLLGVHANLAVDMLDVRLRRTFANDKLLGNVLSITATR